MYYQKPCPHCGRNNDVENKTCKYCRNSLRMRNTDDNVFAIDDMPPIMDSDNLDYGGGTGSSGGWDSHDSDADCGGDD